MELVTSEKRAVILATKKIIDSCVVHFTDMQTGRLDVNMCIDALFNTVQHILAVSLIDEVNKNALIKDLDRTLRDLMTNLIRDLNEPELACQKQRFVTMAYVEVLKDMVEKDLSATTH